MAEEPATPPSEIRFVDNPHAPEVFAWNAYGFNVCADGCMAITFVADRTDMSGPTPWPINRVVVGRVIMPFRGAASLAAGLYDFMKAHNLLPPEITPPDKNAVQ